MTDRDAPQDVVDFAEATPLTEPGLPQSCQGG